MGFVMASHLIQIKRLSLVEGYPVPPLLLRDPQLPSCAINLLGLAFLLQSLFPIQTA
jgi:hypothetical protein